MKTKLTLFRDALRLYSYSSPTIRSYCRCLAKFFNAFPANSLSEVKFENVAAFISELVEHGQFSASYQRQMLGAIGKYFELCEGRKMNLQCLYPKLRANRLPCFLTKDEVRLMLERTSSLKHRCVLLLLYGLGMRLSEVLNLKLNDFDTRERRLLIWNADGKKSRELELSNTVFTGLMAYYKRYKPEEYLLEGVSGGRYSSRSVQAIVKQAANRAEISKAVTPQILRHSFATHMIMAGKTVEEIQYMLGHESIHTTMIYAHMADKARKNLVSPIDAW